ncbi:nuclear transport factor 2 family protein [Flavobacterium xinjiangense]|uniref:Lumazine-binding n=1 Tax=Flavobacterium xinjiangense TaxID=178356 RepID=A0A1M7PFL5_9FLAO|nr:nuclear transport factor 2 family protein [Flavobacterium xinjiangense]SHN15795.1 hypothetical protein SAMN05216269_1172 [Flavobacterium xinjiangense]
MKRLTVFLILLLISNLTFGQNKETTDKKEIKQILNSFMDCIVKKDSIKFYTLFHNDPIVWIGVIKKTTHEVMLKKEPTRKNYFESTYKEFYRLLSDASEEKFYNIDIKEDGSIAAVTFDYSFWKNKIKANWGAESWGLIKVNGNWKITSVLFSLESEKINPEPIRAK